MRAAIVGALAAASLCFASAARADASAADQALAEALFREAKRLVASGTTAEACPKFAESHRLDPHLGTLLYLATCHEQEGKTASAWVEYGEAADLAARQKQSDRVAIAKTRAAALEPKLAHVVVKAVATPGLAITFDGRPLGAASFGTPFPVDPGLHAVAASAPGKKPWSVAIDVAHTAATSEVGVPALEDEVAAPPPPAPSASTAVPEAASAPAGGDGSTRTLGFVLGGAGVVAIGVGSYFGLHAASQRKNADGMCIDTACTQAGLDEHSRARTSALVSTIAFGVGIPALVAGVWLVLASPGAAAGAHTNTLRIAPAIDPRSARLVAETPW